MERCGASPGKGENRSADRPRTGAGVPAASLRYFTQAWSVTAHLLKSATGSRWNPFGLVVSSTKSMRSGPKLSGFCGSLIWPALDLWCRRGPLSHLRVWGHSGHCGGRAFPGIRRADRAECTLRLPQPDHLYRARAGAYGDRNPFRRLGQLAEEAAKIGAAFRDQGAERADAGGDGRARPRRGQVVRQRGRADGRPPKRR